MSDDLSTLVKELKKVRLRCQPVLVVAGSGISAPAIPLMQQIIDRAVDIFNRPDFANDTILDRHPELRTPEGLGDIFREDPDPILRHSDAWKKGVMKWLLDVDSKAVPQPQHLALMELLGSNLVRAIVTPNWDSLLHKAGRNLSAGLTPPYVVIRDPYSLEHWFLRSRSLPALVKIHGDVNERHCRLEHVTVVTEADPGLHCQVCGEPTTQKMLLPDSARRLSRRMIDYFSLHGETLPDGYQRKRDVLPDFGAIIIIGFSGQYDAHLLQLAQEHSRTGALVAHLDLQPRNIFPGRNVLLIQGSAEELVPPFVKKWIRATRESLHQTFGKSSSLSAAAKAALVVPPLPFVRSEERSDSIFGRIPVTRIEADILSHPQYARLRGIRQLGPKQRFYTSANHSRFEHSLACVRVVDELYLGLVDAVERARQGTIGDRALAGYMPTPEERQLLRLVALFHDFGHVWFSHLGETVLADLAKSPRASRSLVELMEPREGHEGMVELFLNSPRSEDANGSESLAVLVAREVCRLGKEIGIDLQDFYSLIDGDSRLSHLNALVASSIDADKLEYLNRDAVRTGTTSGAIRPDLVGQGLEVTELGLTTVRQESLSVVERVFAERYLMFQSVYHDDRILGLEASLAQVLTEFLERKFGALISIDQIVEVLLFDEERLLNQVRDAARQLGHAHQAEHWEEVLDLVMGSRRFPQLDVWLLYPSDHASELPVQEATTVVDKSVASLRHELAGVFRRRYQHRAVFALDRVKTDFGRSEVLISGESDLYFAREVSPLIAGLQDVRKVPIHLSVVYYDPDITESCREEIEAVLPAVARELEIRWRRRSGEGDTDVG